MRPWLQSEDIQTGPTTSPARVSRPYPHLGHSLLLIVVWWLIGSVASLALGLLAGGALGEYDLLLNGLVIAFASGVVLLLGTRPTGVPVREALGLQQARPGMLLPTLLLGVAGFLLFFLIEMGVEQVMPTPEFFRRALEYVSVWKGPIHMLGSLVVVVGVAPVMEELLFRGLILRGLVGNHGAVGGVVLTAVLFGVIHLNPAQVVGATLLGVLAGLLVVAGRSVYPAIGFHALNNLLALLLVNGVLPFSEVGDAAPPLALVVMLGVLALVALGGGLKGLLPRWAGNGGGLEPGPPPTEHSQD